MFEIRRDSFWGRKLEQLEEKAFKKSEFAIREMRNRKDLGEQERRILKDMERKRSDMERKRHKKQSGHGHGHGRK